VLAHQTEQQMRITLGSSQSSLEELKRQGNEIRVHQVQSERERADSGLIVDEVHKMDLAKN